MKARFCSEKVLDLGNGKGIMKEWQRSKKAS